MADELTTKRIINLPAESAPDSGDVLVVDNQSNGTKKLPVSYFENEINSKIAKPAESPDGISGQILRTNGDGTTEWVDAGLPTDEQTAEAISAWLSEHPEATTTVQDGSISYSKLSAAVKVGITCDALGMTPNDANGENFAKLCSAFNEGKTVLVDGTYMLSTAETEEITAPINLTGITEDAKLTFSTGGKAFGISGTVNIVMSNLAIENTSESPLTLFYIDPLDAADTLIPVAYVDECTFSRSGAGYLRFIEYSTVIGTAPSESFGINRIIFTNNFCDNVNTFFFLLIGTPIRYAFIAYNKIHNHNHVLYYAAIDNTDAYDAEIKESRKMLVIRGNVTINDDGYWSTTSNGNYCCIALSESKVIYVVDNYTEGIHSENNCTITDVYTSAEYAYITKNTRKNLASFATNVTATTIFRLKGVRVYGEYKDNTYIVEDDYATRVGKTGTSIKTVLLLEGVGTGTVVISGNYVKTQTLLGMSYTCENDTLIFDGNIINAKYWGKSAPIYALSASSSKAVLMRNNVIKIANIDSGIAFSILYGHSYTNAFDGEQAENIVFENNIIEILNDNSMASETLFRNLSADRIRINNNNIKIDDKGTNGFLVNKCMAKTLFSIAGQTVERNKPYVSYSPYNLQYTSVVDESDICTIASESMSGNFINSDMDYLADTDFESLFTSYEYTLYMSSGYKSVAFEVYRYTDNDVEKIKVTKDGETLYDNSQNADSNIDVSIISDTICKFTVRVYKQGNVANKMAKLKLSWVSVPVGTRYREIQKTIKIRRAA